MLKKLGNFINKNILLKWWIWLIIIFSNYLVWSFITKRQIPENFIQTISISGYFLTIFTLIKTISIEKNINDKLLRQEIVFKIKLTLEQIKKLKEDILKQNLEGDKDGDFEIQFEVIISSCNDIKNYGFCINIGDLENIIFTSKIEKIQIILVLRNLENQLDNLEKEIENKKILKKGDKNEKIV